MYIKIILKYIITITIQLLLTTSPPTLINQNIYSNQTNSNSKKCIKLNHRIYSQQNIKLIFNFTTSTFVIFIFSLFMIIGHNNVVQASNNNTNTLGQTELQSMIWLIKQYGIGSPLSDESCNNKNYPFFICSSDNTFDGQYHITQFTYGFNKDINQGPINKNITQLYMPGLKSFYLYSDPYYDISINILTMLKNLPQLIDLRIRNQQRTTYIPKDFPFQSPLEIFQFTNNAAKDISGFNSTKYYNLKDFEFSTLSSIPDGFGQGMTSKMTISIKGGSNFAPDSMCNATSVSISSYYQTSNDGYIAPCFLCYFGIAPVTIHPQPIITNGSSYCNVSVSNVHYDQDTVTIFGNHLGWAVQGDVDYVLSSIIPNSILVYNASPNIMKDLLELKIALSYAKKLNVIVPLTFITVYRAIIKQDQFGIRVDVYANFNKYVPHRVKFEQEDCIDGVYDPVASIYTCYVYTIPSSGEYNITISNQIQSKSIKSNFTVEYPYVTATNFVTVKGGIVNLYGYFGENLHPLSLSIQVNYKCCTLKTFNTSLVTCDLPPTKAGLALLIVSIDGFEYQTNTLLSIDQADSSDSYQGGTSSSSSGNSNDIGTGSSNHNGDSNQDVDITALFNDNKSRITILVAEIVVISLLVLFIISTRNNNNSPNNLIYHKSKQEV